MKNKKTVKYIDLFAGLAGYENYEFIFVEVYDIKPSADPFDDEETAIQTGMLIWAKELKWITVAVIVRIVKRQPIYGLVGVHIGIKLYVSAKAVP